MSSAIIPRIVHDEAPSLDCSNKYPEKTSPFPFPGLPWRTSTTSPRSAPPRTPRGAVSNRMNRQRFRAISRLLRSCFPEASPGELLSVHPPRLFAACAPPPLPACLHPPVHGILNSDSPCPMGTAHPPMEGLLPPHHLLDAPLAWLAGLARQRDPLRVASQCHKAQLSLAQSHLHPPVKSRLRNSNNPAPPSPPPLDSVCCPLPPCLEPPHLVPYSRWFRTMPTQIPQANLSQGAPPVLRIRQNNVRIYHPSPLPPLHPLHVFGHPLLPQPPQQLLQ